MSNDTQKSTDILKWRNTAHITKMSIEGLVAAASLAGAITAILIATKVIAGPTSLAFVAGTAGIAVLFIAAVYFAAAAYASYQQMHAIGEKGEKGDPGEKGPQGEKGDKGNELTDDDLKQKIKAFLVDPNVVTMDVKAAFK